MSGHTARVRASNDRASLYTEITDKIIAEFCNSGTSGRAVAAIIPD